MMPALPSPIELGVYACRTDALVFVPSVCLPPSEAEMAFGPLSRIGTVSVPEECGAWQAIVEQIDRHLFAAVPRQEADLLAGIEGSTLSREAGAL